MYQESVNVLQQLFRFGTDGVTTVGTADVFAHVNGCREQNNVEVYEYIRQVSLKCRLQQPSTTFNNLQQHMSKLEHRKGGHSDVSSPSSSSRVATSSNNNAPGTPPTLPRFSANDLRSKNNARQYECMRV